MLAMEFFAVGGEALFNEMAPRVHNSGHWTIEGARTSQFENHIRAICGLPLGAHRPHRAARRDAQSDRRRGRATGREILAEPGAHLHLYGKGEARPGRKMGHVTRLLGAERQPRLSPFAELSAPAVRRGWRHARQRHHLDRQAKPLELRADPRRIADHHPDEIVGID